MNKQTKNQGKIKDISKATLKDKAIIAFDQFRLKHLKKEWTPKCKKSDFCCIVCGAIHRNIMSFDTSTFPSDFKKQGEKTAKRVYTLNFCSDDCANKFSTYAQMELFDLEKLHEHLDSDFWKKQWLDYYNWKIKEVAK